MRIIFILTLLLWLLALTAPAKGGEHRPSLISLPDPDELKAYIASMSQDGFPLKAFNFVQDTRHQPHVAQVRYDIETDRFYWQGPRTGKEMSMDRERFMTQVWAPYTHWCELHPAP